ncbi:hypothetical protein AOLI_G00199790 [Acnodon oligacanthus]
MSSVKVVESVRLETQLLVSGLGAAASLFKGSEIWPLPWTIPRSPGLTKRSQLHHKYRGAHCLTSSVLKITVIPSEATDLLGVAGRREPPLRWQEWRGEEEKLGVKTIKINVSNFGTNMSKQVLWTSTERLQFSRTGPEKLI